MGLADSLHPSPPRSACAEGLRARSRELSVHVCISSPEMPSLTGIRSTVLPLTPPQDLKTQSALVPKKESAVIPQHWGWKPCLLDITCMFCASFLPKICLCFSYSLFLSMYSNETYVSSSFAKRIPPIYASFHPPPGSQNLLLSLCLLCPALCCFLNLLTSLPSAQVPSLESTVT